MKYWVQQIDRRPGHWVEVSSLDRRDVAREAWMLPPLPLYHLTEEDMVAINDWVVENQLGSRKSFNQWKLRSAQAVTAFRLKWG